MIGCLGTCVCKQPIIALYVCKQPIIELYFEFETVLKFYNLGASSCSMLITKANDMPSNQCILLVAISKQTFSILASLRSSDGWLSLT